MRVFGLNQLSLDGVADALGFAGACWRSDCFVIIAAGSAPFVLIILSRRGMVQLRCLSISDAKQSFPDALGLPPILALW